MRVTSRFIAVLGALHAGCGEAYVGHLTISVEDGSACPSVEDAEGELETGLIGFVSGDLGNASAVCSYGVEVAYAAIDDVRELALGVDWAPTCPSARAVPIAELGLPRGAIATNVVFLERQAYSCIYRGRVTREAFVVREVRTVRRSVRGYTPTEADCPEAQGLWNVHGLLDDYDSSLVSAGAPTISEVVAPPRVCVYEGHFVREPDGFFPDG